MKDKKMLPGINRNQLKYIALAAMPIDLQACF